MQKPWVTPIFEDTLTVRFWPVAAAIGIKQEDELEVNVVICRS
jgi:hypothetical protein